MKKSTLKHICVFIFFTVFSVAARAQYISTIAGCGIGDDSLATKAEIVSPYAVAFDKAGNAYIADAGNYRIRKVSTDGIITTFAGNGVFGNTGNGGPATAATLGGVTGLAFDRKGNLYVVDESNSCIRKIDTLGIISAFAGTGVNGFSGDGGPATAAELYYPIDVVVDTTGNVIFTDWYNARVRKIDTAGIITTIVGNGLTGTSGNGGPATASRLGLPFRVALDRYGNLYVAEVAYQHICKVDTAGIITIIGDTTGTWARGTDGDGALALYDTMTAPCGLAVDTSGNVYFSDINNDRVRKIDHATGVVSTFAATGIAGYSGDGGPASTARISEPEGLTMDAAGNLYIADAGNNRIRKVDPAGNMSTFAGQNGLFDEGYPAVSAELCAPSGLATDAAGNVYVADYENNRVRKIDVTTGQITTVAGNGIAGDDDGDNGDGGPATAARTYYPYGVAADAAGNIYVADVEGSRVRKIDPTGTISTFAGNGNSGFSSDDGLADTTELYAPAGVAVDAAGNVYIADYGNARIRKVNTAGYISTIAGTGIAGYSGDGGHATLAKLAGPMDVAVDGLGNLYIDDDGNNCIRKVDTAGIITTITAPGAAGFSGDGGPSTLAQVNNPSGLQADSIGNVYFADQGNNRIRMINRYGIINTIAGDGTAGFSGDGGLATAAMLNSPTGVAIDHSGNLFIADGDNFRVRKVNITSILTAPQTQLPLATVTVYPNPAHDKVYVTTTSNLYGGEQLSLFNATGQQVYSAPFIQTNQAVDVAGLPGGIYILQITNAAGEKKVVKVTKD